MFLSPQMLLLIINSDTLPLHLMNKNCPQTKAGQHSLKAQAELLNLTVGS